MGDIKGFIKYKRETPGNEPVETRTSHFKEFVQKSDDDAEKRQSARCMDCGVPFCHSACPLGNLIPNFNHAVYEGKWRKAYNILRQTNNFPEFTGRICPAPCESSCVLGINNNPVSIEYIEKSIIEKAFKNGWVKSKPPKKLTGKQVAVVGSGPAGLAAADQLRKSGHEVTVFERDDKVGGLLRYGIPDFKLEKGIIDRRIEVMEKTGIVFKTNTNIGEDITVDDLQSNYDAVILCGGSTIPRDLNIEGRNAEGIHFAMDFLKQTNKMVAGSKEFQNINVTGKDVVVIGGGDTGSDCIGTSNRFKAKSVTQIEIMSKPPGGRGKKNPWPQWPMILRTTSSHEEGCEREWNILTKKFHKDANGSLTGLEVVEVEWSKGAFGRYQMNEVEGSEKIIPCQAAFLAIGFLHAQKKGMIEDLDVQLDDRGNVDTKNYETSVPGIFAAGDMRRGQSLVVWAISEGREAANAVNDYLGVMTKVKDSKLRSVLAV